MRELEIRLVGLPTSVNNTRRRHWTAVVEETATWRSAAHFATVDALNRSPDPLARKSPIYPAEVEYVFLLTARRGDLDNLVAAAKPILDGIVSAKAIADDSVDAVRCLSARWRRSSEAGVIVRIKEAE